MVIKQISVFLENKLGSLADVTRCLADNGVNILALCIADTTDFGILRLIVSDHEKAVQALNADGNAVKMTDVIAIEVEHEPGALYSALARLDAAGIGVEYTYAFVGNSGKASVILKPTDINKSLDELKNCQQARVLSAREIHP